MDHHETQPLGSKLASNTFPTDVVIFRTHIFNDRDAFFSKFCHKSTLHFIHSSLPTLSHSLSSHSLSLGGELFLKLKKGNKI